MRRDNPNEKRKNGWALQTHEHVLRGNTFNVRDPIPPLICYIVAWARERSPPCSVNFNWP